VPDRLTGSDISSGAKSGGIAEQQAISLWVICYRGEAVGWSGNVRYGADSDRIGSSQPNDATGDNPPPEWICQTGGVAREARRQNFRNARYARLEFDEHAFQPLRQGDSKS
jgi:hypothetical protein